MIFDPNNVQVRLHPSPLLAGAMAWEAVVSVARHASADFVCQPGSGEGGLGHTLASWLADAGPQVALQWCMGGLWKPGDVGAMLSIAVVGSSPDQAQRRVLERAGIGHVDGHPWGGRRLGTGLSISCSSPRRAITLVRSARRGRAGTPVVSTGLCHMSNPRGRHRAVSGSGSSHPVWPALDPSFSAHGVEADRLVARWLEVRPPPRRG